jgi:hypothetical protein
MSVESPELNLKFVKGTGFVDADAEVIAVPKIVVSIADYLSELIPFASPNGHVEGENDWKIIHKIWEAFTRCYPDQYAVFLESVTRLKHANIRTGGYSDNRDIQHQMEIPQRFDQLLKLFYPLQSYDTKFARRLVKEIPALKAI